MEILAILCCLLVWLVCGLLETWAQMHVRPWRRELIPLLAAAAWSNSVLSIERSIPGGTIWAALGAVQLWMIVDRNRALERQRQLAMEGL